VGTLILIRHGRTPANKQGILAGRNQSLTLDDVGVRTAKRLKKKFSKLDVKHVAASPLARTVDTAQIIFPNHSIDLQPDLIECEYGDWTGQKISDLAKEPLWESVQKSPHLVTFPNGESMQEMSDRSIAIIHKLDNELTAIHGENFIWAAVSHGDVIKAIIAQSLGLELAKFQKIYVDPASVTVLRFIGEDSALVKANDTGDGWVKKLGVLAKPTLGGQTGAEGKEV
jgi:2,3-bisphosphoglycerate-dependent phosphoglycerate mutase